MGTKVLADDFTTASLPGLLLPRERASPVSSSPSSGSPNAFYRNHFRVEEPRVDATVFRPGWRVQTRLERLLADQVISPPMWRAAVIYRDTYAIAFGSSLGSSIDRVGLGRRPARSNPTMRLEPAENQLAAVERLAMVRRRLGAVVVQLIDQITIEDACWAEIGRQFRISPKTARVWALTALSGLAHIL